MLATCSQEILVLPSLPLNSDVIFLSDFDGADFATTAVDRSVKNAAMTFSGSAHLDVLNKKFGTASYANSAGSGGGIRLPVDPDYTLITGDFTVETFVFSTAAFNFNALIAGVFGAGAHFAQSQWGLHLTGTTIRFVTYGSDNKDYVVCNHGLSANRQWHVAVCRCNLTIRLFVDGVMLAKDLFLVRSLTPNPSTIGMSLGNDWDLQGSVPMQGNLDAMRVTKKAWYRTDDSFTPPGAPYGTIAPGLFVDPDTFYNARTTPYTLSPALFVDTDVIIAPHVSPQTVAPLRHTDTDTFFAPAVHIATHWDTSFSVCALSGANLVATNNQGTSTTAGAIADVNAGRNSGLIYYEITATSVGGAAYGLGVVFTSFNYAPLSASGSGGIIFLRSGHVWINGVDLGAIMPAMVSGDVYGFAVHLGRRLMWIRKVNGTPGDWNGDPVANPDTVVGGLAVPAGGFILPVTTLGGAGGSGSDVQSANFGQASFAGTVPANYERGYVGGF